QARFLLELLPMASARNHLPREAWVQNGLVPIGARCPLRPRTTLMIDKVTIDRFAEISGYTAVAIRTKIERGVWPEGVYIRAPDNRILISIRGYEEWAEGRACASLVPTQSRSTSDGRALGAGRVYGFRHRKRTSATAKPGSGE